MEPLQKIYWLRVTLGVVAALLCAAYGILVPGAITNTEFPLYTFLNSISIALVFYLITFYIIKNRFILKVDKPQKLATMGIGIYFITWLVVWALLFTLIAGPTVYTLTITAAGGTTQPAIGAHNFYAGNQVSVRAIPNINYTFDHWEIDGTDAGTGNPIIVVMMANHTLNAVFQSLP
jgi:hypothetical protein